MTKLAVVAYTISLVATAIGLAISKELSLFVLLSAAYAPVVFVLMWFQYKAKRVPVEAEFSRFYKAYAVFVFGSLLALVVVAPSVTAGGVASMLILSAMYWGAMRAFFTETMLNRHFRKKSG